MSADKEREMLKFADLPDDNADLANISVSFPVLDDNSPGSCPVPLAEIVEYVSRESGGTVSTGSLSFLRTAKVSDRDYWIWELTESDGARAYVTVSKSASGTQVGYSPDFYNLTPEQFMLGDYYDVF